MYLGAGGPQRNAVAAKLTLGLRNERSGQLFFRNFLRRHASSAGFAYRLQSHSQFWLSQEEAAR